MNQINQEEQIEMLTQTLKVYQKITQMCFQDCVHDFSTRTVSQKEKTCTNYCMNKFIKLSERLNQRFLEKQQILNPYSPDMMSK